MNGRRQRRSLSHTSPAGAAAARPSRQMGVTVEPPPQLGLAAALGPAPTTASVCALPPPIPAPAADLSAARARVLDVRGWDLADGEGRVDGGGIGAALDAALAVLAAPPPAPHSPPFSAPVFDRTSIAGDVHLGEGGAAESWSNFGTALSTARAHSGRVAFSVELITAGIQQLGWATPAAATAFTNEEGAGDASGSYAFDGRRVRAWAGQPRPYGAAWTRGDVITCCLDAGAGEVSFRRNGVDLGVAFSRILPSPSPSTPYAAAVSLSRGERVCVNVGGDGPVAGLPPGFEPLVPPPGCAAAASYLVRCLLHLAAAGEGALSGASPGLAASFAPGAPAAAAVAAAVAPRLARLLAQDPAATRYVVAATLEPGLVDLAARGGLGGARAARAALAAHLAPLAPPLLAGDICRAVLTCLARTTRISPVEGGAGRGMAALRAVRALLADAPVRAAWTASPDWHAHLEDLFAVRTPTSADLERALPPAPGRARAARAASLAGALAALEAAHVGLAADLASLPAPGALADAASPGGRAARAARPSSRLDELLAAVARRNRGARRALPPPGLSDPATLVSLFLAGGALAAPALEAAERGAGSPLDPFPAGPLWLDGAAVGPASPRGDRYGGGTRLGGDLGHVLGEMGAGEAAAAAGAWLAVAARGDGGDAAVPAAAYATPPRSASSSPSPSPSSDAWASASSGGDGESSSDGGGDARAAPRAPPPPLSPDAAPALVDRLVLLYHTAVGAAVKEAGAHAQSLALSSAQLDSAGGWAAAPTAARRAIADAARVAAWHGARLLSPVKTARLRSLAAFAGRVLAAAAHAPGPLLAAAPEAYAEAALDAFHAARASAAAADGVRQPPGGGGGARFADAAPAAAAGRAAAAAAARLAGDARVASPDARDLALQCLAAMLACPAGAADADAAPDAAAYVPGALLDGMASRGWVPAVGVAAVLAAPACLAPPRGAPAAPALLAAFATALRAGTPSVDAALDKVFSMQSWALTEAAAAARDAGAAPPGATSRRRRAATLDLAASLGRVVEFCAAAAPALFLGGDATRCARAVDAAAFQLAPGPGGGLPAAGCALLAPAAGALAGLCAGGGRDELVRRLAGTPAAAGLAALAAARWAPVLEAGDVGPGDGVALAELDALVAGLAGAAAAALSPTATPLPPPHDDFVDPITSDVMADPVVLPSSKVRVDRATLERLLLARAPADPFSRAPLARDGAHADAGLKARIDEWRAAALEAMEE